MRPTSLRRWIAAALAVSLTAGCGNAAIMTTPGGAQLGSSSAASSAAPRFANRVIVKYKDPSDAAAIRSFQQRFGLRSVRAVNALGIGVMSLSSDPKVAASTSVSALQTHPAVAYAEPDYVFKTPPVQKKKAAVRKLQAVSLDAQWGLSKIGMPNVWKRLPAIANMNTVTVAVVDTGVDVRHPDLAANLVPGASMVAGTTGPDDDHGHGTHCAGIIGATGKDILGVAPRIKIMPVKVLNSEGTGDTGDIVEGIVYAVDHGAKVLSLSLGGAGGGRALLEAVNYALARDVVVVAAMGNNGENAQEFPAGYPGVIAVGASDSMDYIADFSNTGSWISVVAPGSDILSTLPTHAVTVSRSEGMNTMQDYMDGTSMATPFVAAAAALLRGRFPALKQADVKARLEATADDVEDPGFDIRSGYGRLNVERALFDPTP